MKPPCFANTNTNKNLVWRFHTTKTNNYLRMKTKIVKSVMFLAAAPATSSAAAANSPLSYIIGGIVALFILGYLVYTLLRPDKF